MNKSKIKVKCRYCKNNEATLIGDYGQITMTLCEKCRPKVENKINLKNIRKMKKDQL